jgi:hypothetical protein
VLQLSTNPIELVPGALELMLGVAATWIVQVPLSPAENVALEVVAPVRLEWLLGGFWSDHW